MPIFQTAYTDLLDMAGRPANATMLAAAKRELNQAIRQLQREHAYRYTERLFTFTYPAAALLASFSSICDGSLRDIASIQLLGAGDTTEGLLLEMKTYPWLQGERGRYQNRQLPAGDEYIQNANTANYASAVCRNRRAIAVMVGNGVAIYPTPVTAVNLLVNCHIWLPSLVETTDTNFFLEYGYDTVLAIALRRFQIYLKTDSRYLVAATEVQESIATLKAWDAQVHATPLNDPR